MADEKYKQFWRRANEALDILTPREAKILRLSFGIEVNKTTDAVIAGLFDIEVSRVEQYRVQALRKLRDFSTATSAPSIVVPKAIEEIANLSPELLDRLRSHAKDLEKLRPDVFEQLVGELLASRGFTEVELVGRKQDTSADLLATKYIDDIGEHRYFVEVKRWKDSIGVEVIDRVHGAVTGERSRHGWTAAIIVSIAGFKKFRKYSLSDVANLGIYLKGREDLINWLEEYNQSPNGLWLPSNKAK